MRKKLENKMWMYIIKHVEGINQRCNIVSQGFQTEDLNRERRVRIQHSKMSGKIELVRILKTKMLGTKE